MNRPRAGAPGRCRRLRCGDAAVRRSAGRRGRRRGARSAPRRCRRPPRPRAALPFAPRVAARRRSAESAGRATRTRMAGGAGIPTSSVHHYFGSRDRLLPAVLERGADRLFADLPGPGCRPGTGKAPGSRLVRAVSGERQWERDARAAGRGTAACLTWLAGVLRELGPGPGGGVRLATASRARSRTRPPPRRLADLVWNHWIWRPIPTSAGSRERAGTGRLRRPGRDSPCLYARGITLRDR